MWPFSNKRKQKRKQIALAFMNACKPLPRFTTWQTLNMQVPRFIDKDGGIFHVVEHKDDFLMLCYELGKAKMIYAVSVSPNFIYVSGRDEESDIGHRQFRTEDSLRFVEKLTGLLNAYVPA